MPLTFIQQSEQYLINSLATYINTNIVTPYNAAVTGGPFPQTLDVQLSMPDDPMIKPSPPLIIMPCELVSVKTAQSLGLGGHAVFLFKQAHLEFYPALDITGKPNISAAATLRNYASYAFETGLYIPIFDYSQVGNPQSEVFEITECRIVKSSTRNSLTLNIEKNRFDIIMTLKIPVVTING